MARWLRDAQQAGKAPRTANEYLETACAFLNWCVRSGYLEQNPLAWVGKAALTERRWARAGRARTLARTQLPVERTRACGSVAQALISDN
jgi:hypothetical protein